MEVRVGRSDRTDSIAPPAAADRPRRHAPPDTVKSWEKTYVRRPLIRQWPVTTPSPGLQGGLQETTAIGM